MIQFKIENCSRAICKTNPIFFRIYKGLVFTAVRPMRPVCDDDTKWIDKPVVTLDGDVEVDLLVSVKKSVALLREINDLAPGD